MEFTRKSLPEQHYLYVERECEYGPAIAEAMGSGFAEVFGFVGQNGITPLNMPMSVYHGMDPNILRFQSAVLVSAEDAAKASGNIKHGTIPAGDCMTCTHVGSYNDMSASHQALWQHMKETDDEGQMPVWEIYVDDPGDTAEADLRTELYRFIG